VDLDRVGGAGVRNTVLFLFGLFWGLARGALPGELSAAAAAAAAAANSDCGTSVSDDDEVLLREKETLRFFCSGGIPLKTRLQVLPKRET